MASKVSALESLRVLTLPDVRVALWIKLEIEPALLLENGRKPRIVAPVRFHDHRIVWLFLAQELIIMGVGFGLPNNLPYLLFAGLFFDQRDRGSKFDGVASKFGYTDYFGPRKLILKLANARLVALLLGLGSLVFRIFR